MDEQQTSSQEVQIEDNTQVPTTPNSVDEQQNTSAVEETKEPLDLYSAPEIEQVGTGGAPESYDFSDLKNAQGENYNQVTLDIVGGLAKSLNLNNDQAKEFLSNAESVYNEAQAKAIRAQSLEWQEQLKQDPELGGNNFNKTRANLFAVMSKYGNKEVADIFNKSGLGNHPAFVRMFNEIGKALIQAPVIKGAPAKRAKDLSDFYYNTNRD